MDQSIQIPESLAVVIKAFQFDGGALYLLGEHNKEMALVASNPTTLQFERFANQVPVKNSYLSYSIKDQQALRVEDKRKLPRRLARAIKSAGWNDMLIVPLVAGPDTLGVICLGKNSTPVEWSSEDLCMLTAFGQQIGLIIHNTHMRERVTRSENLYGSNLEALRQRNIQMQLAVESANSISTIRDPQALLQHTVDTIKAKFGFYYVGIFLVDQAGEYALLKAATGKAGARLLATEHKLPLDNSSMIAWCIAHCQPRIAQLAQDDHVRYVNPHLPKTRAEMAVPLIINGECLGALTVQSTQPHAFSEEDIEVIGAVGGQLAIALENADLLETERHNLAEAFRENQLIQSLNTVVTRIQTGLDPQNVLRILGQELNRIGLSCIIGQIEANDIIIRHVFFAHESQQSIENLINLTLFNLRLNIQSIPIYGKAMNRKRATYLSRISAVAKSMLPKVPMQVLQSAIQAAFGDPDPAALYLPLVAKDQVKGVLNIVGADLNQSDLAIFAVFASQVAASLEVARLNQQLKQQRVAEQQILLELSQAILKETDIDKIMDKSVEMCARALQIPHVVLLLPDQNVDPTWLVLKASVGRDPHNKHDHRVPIGTGSASGYAFVQREPVMFSADDSQSPFQLSEWARKAAIRCGMAVPMLVKGKVLGVQTLCSPTVRDFDEHDVRLASLIANTTAQALEGARLFQDLATSEEQFRNLLHATPDATIIVDENGLILRANAQVQDLLGYAPEKLIGQPVELLIPDNMRSQHKSFCASYIASPELRMMGSAHESIAVDKQDRNIPVEIRLSPLQTPQGLQVIAALRDITRRKQAEADRISYEEYLEKLHEITRAALENTDQEIMLDTLSDQIAELFQADDCFITLWDDTDQRAVLATDSTPYWPAFLAPNSGPDHPMLAERVLQIQSPLFIANAFASKFINPEIDKRFPVRSVLALPLIADGHKLGAILISYHQPRQRSLTDLARGEQAAGQISLAIARSIALEREKIHLQEMNSLYDLSRDLVSKNDLETLLDRLSRHTVRALDITYCRVLIPEAGNFCNRASYPVRVLKRDLGVGQEEPTCVLSFYQQALEQDEPVIITQDDVQIEPALFEALSLGLAQQVCLVPLKVSGQPQGLMSLGEARQQARNPFSADKLALIKTISDQAAIAINNILLFDAEKARRLELSRSNEFITALGQLAAEIQNTNNLEDVFSTLGSELTKLDMTGVVGLFDGQSLFVRYFSLESDLIAKVEKLMGSMAYNFQITPDNFKLYSEVIEQRQLIYANGAEAVRNSISALPDIPEAYMNRLLKLLRIDESVGALYLPLEVKSQILGVLWIWGSQLQESDIPAAKVFSSQFAIAIQNAQLYEQVQHHAQQLEQRVAKRTAELKIELSERKRAEEALQNNIHRLELLNSISKRLTAAIDVDELSAKISQDIKAALGVYYVFIGLVEVDQLVIIANVGGDNQIAPDKVRFTIGEDSVSGWVITHNEGLLISDIDLDDRYRSHADASQTHSELVVPIRIAEQVMGVLGVASDQRAAFEPEDMNLLQSIADQLALAIENVKSYQEAQAQRDEAAAVANTLFEQTNHVVSINRIVTILQGAKTLAEASQLLMENIFTEFEIEQSMLLLVEDGSLYLSAMRGSTLEEANLSIAELEACPALNLAWQSGVSTQHTQFVDTTYIDQFFENWLILPINAYGEILGILVLEQGDLDGETLRIMVNQAGLGLASARSYEQLQEQAKELTQSNLDLQRATQAKTDFMNRMSHELRTPLNAILGFSRLLKKEHTGSLNDRQFRYVENIIGSSKHQLALVNDILDMAKVEAGKMELNFEMLSLDEIFGIVSAMIAPQAEAKSISIQIEASHPPFDICADAIRLRQILLNLLSNAIKFTPEGGQITIQHAMIDTQWILDTNPSIAESRSPENQKWILITVADSGIGINAEDYAKVFAEFEQIDSSLTRSQEGTGLGLALSKHLVEAHDGHIWFESVVGEGTTFFLAFPLNEE